MKDLFIQQKKHFGGAYVNVTHSTVHVPTIIYSLGTFHTPLHSIIFCYDFQEKKFFSLLIGRLISIKHLSIITIMILN